MTGVRRKKCQQVFLISFPIVLPVARNKWRQFRGEGEQGMGGREGK